MCACVWLFVRAFVSTTHSTRYLRQSAEEAAGEAERQRQEIALENRRLAFDLEGAKQQEVRVWGCALSVRPSICRGFRAGYWRE